MQIVSTIKYKEILTNTFSRNSIYALPWDGALSTKNDDQDPFSRYKSCYQKKGKKLGARGEKTLRWRYA